MLSCFFVLSYGNGEGGIAIIKTTKEEFIVSAAEYLDRCIQEEERVRIDCEGGRCVLVDGETWVAMVDALGQVMREGTIVH